MSSKRLLVVEKDVHVAWAQTHLRPSLLLVEAIRTVEVVDVAGIGIQVDVTVDQTIEDTLCQQMVGRRCAMISVQTISKQRAVRSSLIYAHVR